MKVFRNASASMTTLASLVALYGVIVTLTVVLSNRILSDPAALEGSRIRFVALIAGILPLGLLVVVAMSIYRLVHDRRAGKPGAAFKVRLTAFFVNVVVLAALPQGVVAVGVLSSAMQMLFNANTGTSLRYGLNLALDYYEEQIDDLEVFAGDGSLQRIVQQRRNELLQGGYSPSIWPEIRERHSRSVGFQLFDAAGRTLIYLGDETYRRDVSPAPLSPGDTSRVNRIAIDGRGLLRLNASVQLSALSLRPGIAVLTTALPEGFEERAATITESINVFSRLETLRPAFVLIVGLMCGFFSLPLFLLSILASFFFSDRIMRPIESLEDAVRRVTEGDYTVRILSRPGEDLGVMVNSFNRMVNELDRTRRRIAQTEKVQAWQEIAQRLAHEVKNPLTPIRLAAERLRRRYDAGAKDFPTVLQRTTESIVRETEALTHLLNEFRSLSHLPDPRPEPILLRELFTEAAAVYAGHPEVTINVDGIDEALVIPADRGQLRQVVVNLFSNAVEASGGTVRIACAADLIEQSGDEVYRIRVEDDGPGLPEDIRDQIFDPYVTSKQDGTGLGLVIVEQIVYDHNGRIFVESAPGSGTTFVITLPAQVERKRVDD